VISRESTGATAVSPGRSRPQLLAASYRAGARILRVLPAGVRSAAAGPGGTAWFWLSAAQRRAALDNYAAVLGVESTDPRAARTARRAFQNYGRMLMDFFVLGSLAPEEVIQRMSADGREHIDAALARGRGVIMAAPHMGSWDMSGAYAAALGYPISTVADPFPGSLNDAVVATRHTFGLKIITVGRSAIRAITQALQANEIVALLCDLEHGPGVSVSFFGRRAIVPGGPAALALKTGAVLLPACQYATGGGYHVHIDPPLALSAADTKETLMQRVIDRFEDFIKERPEQWYAFRPMFDR
jgi:phosphatidylinositol dimannoside acyltransferase